MIVLVSTMTYVKWQEVELKLIGETTNLPIPIMLIPESHQEVPSIMTSV